MPMVDLFALQNTGSAAIHVWSELKIPRGTPWCFSTQQDIRLQNAVESKQAIAGMFSSVFSRTEMTCPLKISLAMGSFGMEKSSCFAGILPCEAMQYELQRAGFGSLNFPEMHNLPTQID